MTTTTGARALPTAATATAVPPAAPSAGISLIGAPAVISAGQLLRRCEEGLRVAEETVDPATRFCMAHLAAIRAAAAVLAVRGRPRRGSRTLNVWEVLPRVAPELSEWAAFYADRASRRAAIEAGISGPVSVRDADDLCRQTAGFASVIASHLGILYLAEGA